MSDRVDRERDRAPEPHSKSMTQSVLDEQMGLIKEHRTKDYYHQREDEILEAKKHDDAREAEEKRFNPRFREEQRGIRERRNMKWGRQPAYYRDVVARGGEKDPRFTTFAMALDHGDGLEWYEEPRIILPPEERQQARRSQVMDRHLPKEIPQDIANLVRPYLKDPTPEERQEMRARDIPRSLEYMRSVGVPKDILDEVRRYV